MINLMLVDDNKNYVDSLFKYIVRGNDKIRLCDIGYDGKEAINSILELKPDIILLDLNLPNINGLEILDLLEKEKIHTNIIVLSGINELILKVRKNPNVKYIISKLAGFTEILRIVNEIVSEIDNKNYENSIEEILKSFGFNMNALGTKYLIKSILLSIKNPEYLENIENELYSKVAIIYNVRKDKVKWNINCAIKSMWRYTTDRISTGNYFNRRNSEKPSSGDIINTMVSKLTKN